MRPVTARRNDGPTPFVPSGVEGWAGWVLPLSPKFLFSMMRVLLWFGLMRMSKLLEPVVVDDATLNLRVPTLYVVGADETIYSVTDALERLGWRRRSRRW